VLLPPTRNRRGWALVSLNFEDQYAAHILAVYASRRWSPIPPRNTRFRLLARLYRVGFEPTGLLWEVSDATSLCHLPLPPSLARRYLQFSASVVARFDLADAGIKAE